MAFLIGGANSSAADTGLTNSLRFNDDDSAYLSITPGSAGNRRTYTISTWIKRSNISAAQGIFSAEQTKDDTTALVFGTADSLLFTDRPSDNRNINLLTNRLFRDPSAWYHLVIAVDTTQGTDTNRVKIYVNGVQETSFSTSSYPSQNYDTAYWNNTNEHRIGMFQDNSALHYDGYISEFYFIDGTQYAASDFGETDDDGIWVPKDAKDDLTFGTNGFFLEFKETGTDQDASGIGADTSGEDNHLAVTNLAATDQCTDTPANNFATWNPLIPSTNTYSEGNTLVSMDASPDCKTTSTIGVSKGKWYMEFLRNDNDNWPVGIAGSTIEGAYIGGASTDSLSFWVGLAGGGAAETQLYVNGSQIDDPWNAATWADGDVVALLLNADDEEISLYKNNSIVGSAYDYSGLNWSQVFFTLGRRDATYKTNFGNPSFTISSGNADANGYGNFEHAPPNGYYALCTKNLAEFG